MAKDRFYFHYSDEPGAELSWLRRGDEGTRQGSAPLSELGRHSAGAEVIAVMPGRQALLTTVTAPTSNRAKLRQAIPYLLEEQLAADVESQFFALGPELDGGRRVVVVVQRSFLETFRSQMEEVELRVDLLCAQSWLLPLQESRWSVLLDEDGVLLRTATWESYAVDHDNLIPMLELLRARHEENPPEGIELYDARGDGESPQPELAGIATEYHRVENLLALFADGDDPTQRVNLLQGEFSRGEQLGKMLRPWRSVAAVALLWLVTQLSISILHYRTMAQQEEQLYEKMNTIFAEAFPGERIVNPRVQMEQKFTQGSGGGGDGFITLMAQAAPVLGQHANLTLQTLRYTPVSLEIDVQLQDLPSLDKLKQKLIDVGLTVEIQTASSRDDRVESRIRISRETA